MERERIPGQVVDPPRELRYLIKGEKENHFQTCLGWGNVQLGPRQKEEFMPETLDLREFGHIIEKFWAVPICCTEISWLDSRYIPEKTSHQ